VFSRLLLATVVLASTCNALRAEDKFKPFTSNEGKFTVLMSGTPKEQKQTVKAGGVDVTTHLFLCEIDPNRAVIVSFNEIPGVAGNPAAVDKILEATPGLLNSTAKGKVLSVNKISLGKSPGREVQIELPEGKGIMKVNVYLVGSRLYQVLGIGPESFVRSPQLDRYYKSFKVNE
jgi:hypothetical protein